MLAQPITDGPHETPKLAKKGIPFLSVEAIVNNKLDFTRKRGYISLDYNNQCNKKYKPQLYDVYLVKSGSTVGKVAIVETNTVFNIWSPLAAMRVNSFNNPYFLYYLLQTDKLQDQIKQKSKGGTQPNLSMRILEKCSTAYTDLKEETQIASLLDKVDQQLVLQQRKLDQLKLLKKAMLQNMFTKESTPSLRFIGFYSNWNVSKLQNITKRLDNARVPISASKRVSGVIPYYGANEIQDHVKGYTHNGEYLLIAEDGANDVKNYPIHYVKGKIWVNNHAHVLQVINNKSDILFLLYALKTLNMEKYLVGGSRAKLNAAVLMKLPIKSPELIEQHNIGSLLMHLDTISVKCELKIKRLKQIKQFLLQNMFI